MIKIPRMNTRGLLLTYAVLIILMIIGSSAGAAPEFATTADLGGYMVSFLAIGAVIYTGAFLYVRFVYFKKRTPEAVGQAVSYSGFEQRKFSAPIRSGITPKPSTASSDPRAPRIFISYRRSDSADVTGRIGDRLVQRFGREATFKDVDSIPLGIDFRHHLDSVVGQCDVLLAVIGDDWLGVTNTDGQRRLDDPHDYVRYEIESALERGILVVPLLVEGTPMPKAETLPATLKDLAYRNALSIRPDPDFHVDMDRLIEELAKQEIRS